MTKKFACAYVEEDGFSIIRDDVEFMVYGTCEGMYTYYHQDGRMYMKNGDPGYPEETELIQDRFDCWVTSIELDGVEQEDMTLSDDEMEKFDIYMSEKLDKEAEEYDYDDQG